LGPAGLTGTLLASPENASPYVSRGYVAGRAAARRKSFLFNGLRPLSDFVLFPLATFAGGAIIHPMKLKPGHPALTEARTIHPRTRKLPFEGQVIKAVANNGKLGKGSSVITKGKWRGMPMFSITLEERATCPSTCMRWAECFGNGMAFAHRFQHGPDLEAKIKAEVEYLAKIYPHGFVIRLHILGDFYSQAYVDM